MRRRRGRGVVVVHPPCRRDPCEGRSAEQGVGVVADDHAAEDLVDERPDLVGTGRVHHAGDHLRARGRVRVPGRTPRRRCAGRRTPSCAGGTTATASRPGSPLPLRTTARPVSRGPRSRRGARRARPGRRRPGCARRARGREPPGRRPRSASPDRRRPRCPRSVGLPASSDGGDDVRSSLSRPRRAWRLRSRRPAPSGPARARSCGPGPGGPSRASVIRCPVSTIPKEWKWPSPPRWKLTRYQEPLPPGTVHGFEGTHVDVATSHPLGAVAVPGLDDTAGAHGVLRVRELGDLLARVAPSAVNRRWTPSRAPIVSRSNFWHSPNGDRADRARSGAGSTGCCR